MSEVFVPEIEIKTTEVEKDVVYFNVICHSVKVENIELEQTLPINYNTCKHLCIHKNCSVGKDVIYYEYTEPATCSCCECMDLDGAIVSIIRDLKEAGLLSKKYKLLCCECYNRKLKQNLNKNPSTSCTAEDRALQGL